MGDRAKLLKCRMCNGTDYYPLAVLMPDKGMPHQVDGRFGSRFKCLGCGNVIDIFDAASIERYILPEGR